MSCTARLSEVTVRLGAIAALSDLSVMFERGVVAIIGPNGSGKTTALNVLSGLVPLAAGKAHIGDHDLRRLRANEIARLGLARTFQRSRILEWLDVQENVSAALISSNHPAEEGRQADRGCETTAQEALALVGLIDSLHSRASTLSFGERKLVELARVHARSPMIALLDEPVSGLHPARFPIVEKVIEHVVARAGLVVLVEHNLDFVRAVAPQTLALARGRVIGFGDTKDVLRDRDVAASFGGA